MEDLNNYADIYKKWEEAGRPDWTGARPTKSIQSIQLTQQTPQDNVNLTYPEQTILLYTKQAWNTFINLPNKSEDDIAEFKDAIHRLQQIVAMRVARRVDTAVWLQP